jgi:hypothetical protein
MERALRRVVEGREVIQRLDGREEDMVEALLSCARGQLRLESRASVPGGWSHELGSLVEGEGVRVLKG